MNYEFLRTNLTPLSHTLTFLGLVFINLLLPACSAQSENQVHSKMPIGDKKAVAQTSFSTPKSTNLLVAKIARQVTVRIFTEPGSGSGVVIARQGQTYTVLTCLHVLAESKEGRYRVLSVDGKIYPARVKPIQSLKGIDLALLQFDSKSSYKVATLGNSDALPVGSQVYAAGFPNYHFINQNAVEETHNWGTKAFRLTTGRVSLLPEQSLQEGYRLGYNNDVELGMSGGPVLNDKGEVVGINGRLKYPVQGIDVFTFADGTKPSVELFEQMEALSWAIPVATFKQSAQEFLHQHNTPI
jgi:serine protease Do